MNFCGCVLFQVCPFGFLMECFLHLNETHILVFLVCVRDVTLHYVTLCYVVLHCVALLYVTLCYVALCCIMLRYVTLCFMLCQLNSLETLAIKWACSCSSEFLHDGWWCMHLWWSLLGTWRLSQVFSAVTAPGCSVSRQKNGLEGLFFLYFVASILVLRYCKR